MRHDDDRNDEHKYEKSHIVEVKHEEEHGESVGEVRKSHGEDRS